jgi:hypothetical protein
MGYRAVSLDLSAYQQISMWATYSTATAGQYTLRLCSDAAGVTALATISLPAFVSGTTIQQILVDAGSALPAGVNSIALYRESGSGAIVFDIQFIMASKAPGSADAITLASMIGHPDSHGAGGDDSDSWYPIAFIDGTMVMLDSEVTCTTANSKGYSGSTKTGVALYRRECFRSAVASGVGAVHAAGGGSSALPLNITSGWNRTDMSTQDGETWFDGTNGVGIGINLSNIASAQIYDSFADPRLSVVRYAVGVNVSQVITSQIHVRSVVACLSGVGIGGAVGWHPLRLDFVVNCNTAFFASPNKPYPFFIKAIRNNTSVGIANSTAIARHVGNDAAGRCKVANNATGYTPRGGIAQLINIDFTDCYTNFGHDQINGPMSYYTLYNCTFDTLSLPSNGAVATDGVQLFMHSVDHNGVVGSHKIWLHRSLIAETDTVTVDAGSTKSWKFTVPGNLAAYPMRVPIGNILGKAGVSTTVTLRVNRTDSNVACRLFIRAGQPGHISSTHTTSSLASASTDTWETLSLTFTPDNTAMVEICVESYLTSGSSGVFYIDNFTASGIATSTELNGLETGMLGETANVLASGGGLFSPSSINGGI